MNFFQTNEIPPQREGKQSDVVEKKIASDNAEAKQLFDESAGRLLNINAWVTMCEGISASFTLTDKMGKPVNASPKEGFFICIEIPGPSASAGHGYDWVQIEKMVIAHEQHYANALALMRVRPCADPARPEQHAHFFKAKATSTFIIRKNGLTVSAEVHGRNEEASVDDDSILNNIRNKMVTVAAMAGIAAIQWEKLVKGLLGKQ